MNALLMDAQTKFNKEEFARGMVQRKCCAVARDAQIISSKEVCALDMGQHGRGGNVAAKDAQTLLRKEECVKGMGQRSNNAAVKDVQNLLRTEEFAFNTEQT